MKYDTNFNDEKFSMNSGGKIECRQNSTTLPQPLPEIKLVKKVS
jgi:hypothetical protein